MRQILIAAAAFAVCGLFVQTPARADMVYTPGGPLVEGGICRITTVNSDEFYGYMAPCATPAPAAKRGRMKR
jgi:hypothetical protein